MTQDGMTIRLHLRRMKVVRVVEDEIDKLVIEVADARTVVRCPACGHRTTKVHETRKVVVRDIPLGRPTTLVWLQRRFECTACGERHTEEHPEIEGKLTRRLARELVRDSNPGRRGRGQRPRHRRRHQPQRHHLHGGQGHPGGGPRPPGGGARARAQLRL
ncbi:MAG: transposase family protein [Actinobacteria bacterium]|nr:transposase family protein [Actinomycetota bacterium]